jgi:hypothetical protein
MSDTEFKFIFNELPILPELENKVRAQSDYNELEKSIDKATKETFVKQLTSHINNEILSSLDVLKNVFSHFSLILELDADEKVILVFVQFVDKEFVERKLFFKITL